MYDNNNRNPHDDDLLDVHALAGISTFFLFSGHFRLLFLPLGTSF